jgi:hypothetical protein
MSRHRSIPAFLAALVIGSLFTLSSQLAEAVPFPKGRAAEAASPIHLAQRRGGGFRGGGFSRGGFGGGYRGFPGARYRGVPRVRYRAAPNRRYRVVAPRGFRPAYRGRGYARRYYRGRYGPRYGYRRGRYRYYYGGYWYAFPWWLPAANYTYYTPYYYAPAVNYDAHVEWCLRRYRSYSPATDTFRGYDGLDHRCRSPYRG